MNPRLFISRAIAQTRSFTRAVLRRNQLEAEMEAELANHLEDLDRKSVV